MRFSNLIASAAVAAAAGGAFAQPVVFTEWNFNSLPTNVIINSPPPSTGHGTAVPLGMNNHYHFDTSPPQNASFVCCDVLASGANHDTGSTNNCWRVRGSFDGTLANAGLGWALQAPQFTQGAEFDVSTVNYQGITLFFDWFTTNQGVRNMQVQYSTNAGATWTNTGPVLICQQNGWKADGVTVDLSSITAVDDNPNFRIRLVSVYDPSYSGSATNPVWNHLPTYTAAPGTAQYNNNSGNWRFDTVKFTGTPIRSVPPAVTATIAPTAVCSSGGTFTVTANVTSGVSPLSASLTVTADLSGVGGSATQQLFDDGSHGDAIAGDSVYSYTFTVPSGQTVGTHSVPVSVTDDQNRTANTSAAIAVGDCSTSSSSRVVISQAFGGGGHIGNIPSEDAPYNADFVELYNRSGQTVSLNGWSVQYADAAGSSGFASVKDQVALSGMIQPGQHVLVRMSDPVAGYNNLPTPDFAQLPSYGGMNDAGGRVALVRSMTLLGTNYNDPSIEDLVGYGDAAATFEGAGPAPTPSPSTNHGVLRNLSGAQDTNQNFNDFTSALPSPRNRAAGGFLAGYASEDVSSVCAGSTVTFTVAVTPAGNSTGISVVADVSAITGSPTTVQLYDDGTHGDVGQNDNTFTLAYTVPAVAAQGIRTITITTTDAQGHTDIASLPLAIGNCASSVAPVVISQVYGGGGNAASGYNADYAQIFNRSTINVDLTGWSFQSCRVSDAGFDSRIALLSGVIHPGEYRLIVCSNPVQTGAVLPTADFTADPPFNMESSSGRTALVSTTNLIHEDFTRSDIVDLVGYGTDCQTFEGVGAVGALSDFTVAVRKQGGCQDTNQNAIDFDVVLTLTLPQNGASPASACPLHCGSADFNCDGDVGTDADIEAFFSCLAGNCPTWPCTNSADFNRDGDVGTDQDIEAFFRVLGGGAC
jgi:hypothetical protein